MKILVVSMRSIHSIRWINQLKDSGHELYYFDVLDGGYIEKWDWVKQFTSWRYKFGNFKGRHYLKKKFPSLHTFFENNAEEKFEQILQEVKPDLIHSFALKQGCLPIYNVMKRHDKLNWLYSSWGNDIFNSNDKPTYKEDLEKVLTRVNYMFSDCHRDYVMAKDFGFKGEFLGVFPGGGGYNLQQIDAYIKPFKDRNILLIKGYQGKLGRCIQVLEALKKLNGQLKAYRLIVFGAHEEVVNYIHENEFDNWSNFTYHKNLAHEQVLELMGQAKIYIGNNISDGMPNTLLEAICAGAYPIQSNPGGATAEIITSDNGALINDSENVEHIYQVLKSVLDQKDLEEAATKNLTSVRSKLEYEKVKAEVLLAYNKIENKR